MQQPVILSKLEQEYLLAAIEAALPVRAPRSFFLWTQGPVQALLPHQIMVCLQFGPDDALLYAECLHSTPLDRAARERLMHPVDGLAVRLARHCRAGGVLPAALDGGGDASGHALAPFQPALRSLGLDNVLLHGTGQLAGGATLFALFRMPQRPGPRPAYFLDLLLPQLHLALLRVRAAGQASVVRAGWTGARQASQREMEILHWVREGKSNQEVGQILGISGLTVKNHLQRIYKALGVSNRTQAVARGLALGLLDGARARA
jgi:transcriptional regulator EpsA